MTELNVQVSNLWCARLPRPTVVLASTDQAMSICSTFLPQDRVASFSMLSHSELLVETQKAAGDRHLSQWHQTLIEEQKKLRGLQTVGVTL